jgi:hypothetical protein
MARIRMIKPEFFDDPDIAALSLAARLCFIGLWTEADKAGRLVENLPRLKVRIFPYDNIEMPALLQELHRKGLVYRYAASNGQGLIWIRSFTKHQRPHPKEPDSVIEPFSIARAVKKHGQPWKNTASRVKNIPSPSESGIRNLGNGILNTDTESGKRTLDDDTNPSSSRVPSYPADFLELWTRYRKGSKSQALKEFLAAKHANPQVLALMLAALDWQTQQPRWIEARGRYRLDTERWIKRRGWEDEPFHAVDESDAAWDRVLAGKGRVL